MENPNTILITGASSGIGRALALVYAAPGTRLFLCARRRDALEDTAEACRIFEAEVECHAVDVEDREAIGRYVLGADKLAPLDLVIANAGVSGGTGDGGEDDDQAREIFSINLAGTLNTIHPIIPQMRTRGRGQIALMASLAAYRGFPGAPAYSAAKAAVKTYGEALRGNLMPHGVEVSTICPGFVRTPMTDANPYKMPFLMEADRAARIIRRGLRRNKTVIAFPWQMHWAVSILSLLPPGLAVKMMSRLPEKP
ncbi:MAG: SDR family NAD(P)-dependent oxidoreductase [Alphaproteobacteria bacterium]